MPVFNGAAHLELTVRSLLRQSLGRGVDLFLSRCADDTRQLFRLLGLRVGIAGVEQIVREIGEDWLLFDFNHPLAGQALSFEVQLIGVL